MIHGEFNWAGLGRAIAEQNAQRPKPRTDDSEEIAIRLFRASLPEYAAQYEEHGYAVVKSRLFPVSYTVHPHRLTINTDPENISAWQYDPNRDFVCVGITDYTMPRADKVIQLCLLLLRDEKHVLRVGNWNGLIHSWDRPVKAYGALRRKYFLYGIASFLKKFGKRI